MAQMSLFSEGETTGSPRDQARFPRTLRALRLARRWKQKDLAARLGIKLRTYISWETGERPPPAGIVVLLGWLLEETARPNLLAQSKLLSTYVLDELCRQAQKDEGGRELAEQAHAELLRSITEEGQQAKSTDGEMFLRDLFTADHAWNQPAEQAEPHTSQEKAPVDVLQQLFALLGVLQQQPELIPIVQDFLQQVAAQ